MIEFNARSGAVKRGMALVPIQFAVTMAAKVAMQGGALVTVFADGSVLLAHGGAEVGQGINTKMIQVASREELRSSRRRTGAFDS